MAFRPASLRVFLVLVLKKSRARVQRSPIEEDKIKMGLSCTFSKNSRRVASSNLASSPPPWMLWQQTLTCHGVMGEEGMSMRGLGGRKRCCEEQEALSYLGCFPRNIHLPNQRIWMHKFREPLTKTCGDLSRSFGLLSWPPLLRPFHKGD